MNLDERFERVAVIGAAGKMGSGIALLAAQELVRLKNLPANRNRSYRLDLFDVRREGLDDLLKYIGAQAAKRAEKKMDAVRPLYAGRVDLQSDEQIARAYLEDTLSIIKTGTTLAQCAEARIVFEAVPEIEALKIDILRKLKAECSAEAWFLTNTSSLPIGYLDAQAQLGGRLVGFHFYNPPAVQKLLELIVAPGTLPELSAAAHEIGTRLGKKIVPAHDIAAFIGNGHFIRDGLHACSAVTRLVERLGEPWAIYAVDKISREGLVRPMGIFQLVDYVGLDVFSCITNVMSAHIKGQTFRAELVERMLAAGVKGGQKPNGAQKDGFFQYVDNQPAGVYSLEQKAYLPLASGVAEVDKVLGPLAASDMTWKNLLKDPEREAKLKSHFAQLLTAKTLGAEMTLAYHKASRAIGQKLVSDGVAATPQEVNTVLIEGFHHLYGPINEYAV